MKLKCDILKGKNYWLRKASTTNNVANFNQIRLFIFKSWTKRTIEIVIHFWRYEIEFCSIPFEPLTIITIGRRYFDYKFFVFKYNKSKLVSTFI